MSTFVLALIVCIGFLLSMCLWILIQKIVREKYQYFGLCVVTIVPCIATIATIILLSFFNDVKQEALPIKVKEIPVTIVPNTLYDVSHDRVR